MIFWIFKKFLKDKFKDINLRYKFKGKFKNKFIHIYCCICNYRNLEHVQFTSLYRARPITDEYVYEYIRIYAGRRGRRSHAHTRMISRDLWVEIARTMKYARSCFLTTLAQFHSNRSRLIHSVQFNPFSRFDQRRGRSMEKHRSYRRGPASPLRTKDPTQSQSMGGFHTPIHYTYFKLSISPRRLPFGSAAWIRRKGSGWIAI